MRKLVLLALFVLMGTPCLAESPVTLKTASDVNRTTIRLSDVFDGVPSGIDRDIATAPAPGKSVTYDVRVLAKLAEQYRLDWQPQSLGDRSVLTRAATRITLDMIQDVVLQKIKQSERAFNGTMEIVFDNRTLEIDLPAERSPDFSLVNFTYDSQNHRFRTEVVAQTGAQPISHQVTGKVVVKRNVPVLSRRMVAGTAISPMDIDWRLVNDDQLGADVLTSVDDLIGQEVRHDQNEGELLRARDVLPPRLVSRGTMVTMKVETPMMMITTQGRAMQDGAKGEVVRVMNVQSKRMVEGTVEATGIVRIGGVQQMALAE